MSDKILSPTFSLRPCTRDPMLRPVIDFSLCQGCTPCQSKAACKTWALYQIEPGETPVFETGRCNGCGYCVITCSFQAISMRSVQLNIALNNHPLWGALAQAVDDKPPLINRRKSPSPWNDFHGFVPKHFIFLGVFLLAACSRQIEPPLIPPSQETSSFLADHLASGNGCRR